jgi:hypothetical protein
MQFWIWYLQPKWILWSFWHWHSCKVCKQQGDVGNVPKFASKEMLFWQAIKPARLYLRGSKENNSYCICTWYKIVIWPEGSRTATFAQ